MLNGENNRSGPGICLWLTNDHHGSVWLNARPFGLVFISQRLKPCQGHSNSASPLGRTHWKPFERTIMRTRSNATGYYHQQPFFPQRRGRRSRRKRSATPRSLMTSPFCFLPFWAAVLQRDQCPLELGWSSQFPYSVSVQCTHAEWWLQDVWLPRNIVNGSKLANKFRSLLPLALS